MALILSIHRFHLEMLVSKHRWWSESLLFLLISPPSPPPSPSVSSHPFCVRLNDVFVSVSVVETYTSSSLFHTPPVLSFFSFCSTLYAFTVVIDPFLTKVGSDAQMTNSFSIADCHETTKGASFSTTFCTAITHSILSDPLSLQKIDHLPQTMRQTQTEQADSQPLCRSV